MLTDVRDSEAVDMENRISSEEVSTPLLFRDAAEEKDDLGRKNGLLVCRWLDDTGDDDGSSLLGDWIIGDVDDDDGEGGIWLLLLFW